MRREELILAFPGLCPCDTFLEIVRSRLLDAVPIVLQGLFFVSYERQPTPFIPGRDAVRFGKNTCITGMRMSSSPLVRRLIKKLTNRTLSSRVVLFGEFLGALVLKISFEQSVVSKA